MARGLFTWGALLLLALFALLSSSHAFFVAAPARTALYSSPSIQPQQRQQGRMTMMGGKVAKFGIFSPAVVVAKILLGEQKLNKVRGKAISLHSQAITEFCYFVGAQGKTRNRLIKKAKTNGDDLGFLW
ncbi:protein proton gradient regulation chloroplastic-like [Nannochloropsis oceanica]